MATITRFEDIDGWKAGKQLSEDFARIIRESGTFTKPALLDQMVRAIESSMANIAEGFDAGSDAEFIRFLKISRRSGSEFQSHLHVALNKGQISKPAFDALYEKAREMKALIGGFIRYLNKCVIAKARGRKSSPPPKPGKRQSTRPRRPGPGTGTGDEPRTGDR